MVEVVGISLREHAAFYYNNVRSTGIVIDLDVVVSQAVRAAQYYEGFGVLQCKDRDVLPTSDTIVLNSEWAMIAPLFTLYVELENAFILETTRSLGVEVYGRSVSEITSEISQKELEIQNLSFAYDLITV